MGGDTPPAGKLSEAMAAALHRAVVAAAPALQQAHDDRVTNFLEGLEARVAPLIAPVLQQALADPATPDEVRPLLDAVANPTHRFDSSLIGIGLAAMLYPFIQAAVAPFAQDIANKAWSHQTTMPASAAELAVAVVKGAEDPKTAASEAAKWGYNGDVFQMLVDITGEPPGLAELLLLYRRDGLGDALLEKAVRQSRVRNEWLPWIQKLKYAPPPAGEVVAGRVKEHLTQTEYLAKLAEAGIDPANGEWMRAAAGRPYGIEQALDLWNRGEIDAGRVQQVVAQSDVNTDFLPDILKLRWYIPPVRSIVAMLRAGAIDDAHARTLLAENGVRPTDIDGYVAEAHHTKATTVRELTEAQVVRMYSARYIDRATATERLQRLHLDDGTIGLLLDFADQSATERYVTAVVTRVHNRYVSYKITENEARSALATDGIPSAMTDDLLRVWHIERDHNLHVLSPAAIVGAYRREEIGAAECKARLLAVGVQQSDLAIVVADAFPPTKPNPAAVAAVVNA